MTERIFSFFPCLMFAFPVAGLAAPAGTQQQAPPGMLKIKHRIWIIQENHSFDNGFGSYPKADGILPGTCLPGLPGSKSHI